MLELYETGLSTPAGPFAIWHVNSLVLCRFQFLMLVIIFLGPCHVFLSQKVTKIPTQSILYTIYVVCMIISLCIAKI